MEIRNDFIKVKGEAYDLMPSDIRVLTAKDEDGDRYEIATSFYDPTGNCQLQCIRDMYAVLQLDSSQCLLALKKLLGDDRKSMILVDIRASYISILEDLFPKSSIVLKAPYKSTNSSDMVIYLLKTNFIFQE